MPSQHLDIISIFFNVLSMFYCIGRKTFVTQKRIYKTKIQLYPSQICKKIQNMEFEALPQLKDDPPSL